MGKQCTKCCAVKDVSEFAWKNKSENKKSTICKECHRQYNCNWYSRSEEKRNKTKARSKQRKYECGKFIYEHLLKSQCIDCGENHPACLQFDHVRDKKEFSICNAPRRGISIERVKEEIKKCEIRCANCHAKKTAKDQNWYEGYKK